MRFQRIFQLHIIDKLDNEFLIKQYSAVSFNKVITVFYQSCNNINEYLFGHLRSYPEILWGSCFLQNRYA